MEAPAGQVIQNEVGVRPLGVRIIATATLILVRPLQLDGGQGILGYASVVGGFGPGLTEVSVPRLVATYDGTVHTHNHKHGTAIHNHGRTNQQTDRKTVEIIGEECVKTRASIRVWHTVDLNHIESDPCLIQYSPVQSNSFIWCERKKSWLIELAYCSLCCNGVS